MGFVGWPGFIAPIGADDVAPGPGTGPGPGPDPEFARTAFSATTRSIHSGHSLTDAYTYGNGWPGDLVRLRDSIMDPDDEGNSVYIARSTIPGSPMHWRWDNPTDPDAREDIGSFDALMITEAGPPPRTTSEFMVDTLDYLCRFTANTIENGADNEVILWGIWPALNGPGTTPENPTPTGEWAGFTFRTGLDEYWRSFKMMADYATWKMHQLYELPAGWRVWLIPGDRWMARVYDDVQNELVPGIEDFSTLFDDDIHPGDLTAYALACFAFSCLYQIDLREQDGAHVPEGADPDLINYIWTIAWELATEYEPVGMGGTEGTALEFDGDVDDDPMPDWTLEDPGTGGGGGPDPEPGELPEFALVATADDMSALAGFSGTQPTVVNGLMRFLGSNTLTGALALPAAQYQFFAGRAYAGFPSAVEPMIVSAQNTGGNWWMGQVFGTMFNGFLNEGQGVWGTSENYGPVAGDMWTIVEAWTDGETAFTQTSRFIDDEWVTSAVLSRPLDSPFTGGGNVIFFPAAVGPDMDLAALGICDHVPDADARAAVRAWATGLIPSGGNG